MNRLALRELGVEILEGVRWADLTTFRLGGPCRLCLTCRTPEQLVQTWREIKIAGEPVVVIGSGSNLLVADEGWDVVVIRYLNPAADVEIEGDRARVNAAMLLDDFVAWAVRNGWQGLEFLSGIPGTVGGAIAGNAGAFGRAVADALEEVEVLDEAGQCRTWSASQLGFAYRRSEIAERGAIVLRAIFRLRKGDASILSEERQRLLDFRRARHPDWRTTPTAGSFFRNVTPSSRAGPRQAAGWFLEQVGAKAFRVGGARVFERHANIIVADPGCTARDVWELSRRMAAAVREHFGISLEPEVRILGKF